MKMTNYLLIALIITSFIVSCQNETSTNEEGIIGNGTYYFTEVRENEDDDLFLREFILIVKENEVTGKSIRWFEEGDHTFLTLANLTMSETDLKGSIDGTVLELQEKETEYGADHPEGYVLKFDNPETWSCEGDQLIHSQKNMVMKKVHKAELKSSTYRKFDNAKITH